MSGWISVFGDLENAASLTIAAGAKLHFMPATGINVGSWDDASKAILKCAGTATAPVELTGHDGGTWEAVNFLDGSVASQTRLDYTTIDMAGVSSNNAVFIRNCSPIFSHCTIMHSSGYGMWTENSPALQVADSIFDSNGNFPISIDIMTNAAGITGSTFTNNNPDGIEQRGGDITQNVHLVYMEQPYILNGQVTIRGTTETPAVLTIDPGVIIKQNTTGGFAVGLPSGEKGAIIAEGTAEHPIIFTTNLSQAPGAWMGFEFYTASPVSSFKHCTIEYAGNANERSIVLSHGAATFEDCIIRNGLGCGLVLYDPGTEVTLTNCTFDHFTTFGVELGDQTNLTMTGGAIHNCSTYGVSIWRAAPTISNVTISSCGIAPLRANPNSRLKHIESLTFDTGASIEYGGGRISGEDEVFPGLPFQIFGSLQVAGTVETPTTLRITAGAKLRFTDNSILLVGSWTDERGILNCQGTSSAPILFDSVNGNPGTWVGLQFLASAIQSELHFTTISHAGQSNNRSIWINGSSPLFSDCTIANGTGYGAFLETGGTPAIINCVFQSNTSYPISLDINVNANLAGNTFTGNNPDTVEYRGGVMTADRRLKNAGAAYDFNGTIEVRGTIGSPAILTIDPGVTIRFSAGQNLIIGGSTSQPGALIAIGTATQPIVFTGQTQASGSWGGIVLNDGTVDSITHIAFCQIERAIKGIAIESGANGCAITDSQISFCSEYGVSVFEADSTTLERVIVNDLAESGSGLCFTSGTNIRVLNCAILRSGVYAIKIIDSGVDITNSIVDTAQTGVYLSASSASLQTVTIKNVIGMPISIDIQSSLPACTNITLVDNDFNSIEHRGGHASNASHLFYVNYPYLLKNSINCDASLTIDPGVILRLNSGVEIDADAIAAVGSVDNQIIITANSAAPSPGYWSDLKIGPSQTPSDLEYVTIEYGGSLSWSIIAHGSVAFHNCTIRFSGSDGVLASNGCEFINSTIIQNNRDGIQLSGMDNIIQYCTISNNLRDGVESIDGAHKIDRSMIMGNSGVGIRVIMPGTKLAVHYSTIRGNLQGGAASTIHNNTDINGTLRRYQCVNGLSQWLMV